MRRCKPSYTVVVGSNRYRGVECCVERRDSSIGEIGVTYIYRRREGSSKCQKGGCYSGRGVGEGPIDVEGHYLSTRIIGTFVSRGRFLVFGFQEQCLQSNNSLVPDCSSNARDEIWGVQGCVKQQLAPAENSSSNTTILHKVII